MKFTFTNKEEYLAYRSAWKAEYKELSKTIRQRKWLHSRYCSIANKACVEIGMNYPNIKKYFDYIDMMKKEDEKYTETHSKQNWKISLKKLKQTATEMLAELKLSKIEANRQYLEQKQSVEPVSV